jgi:hypothetical protein
MKLYHGSEKIVEKPMPNQGNPTNDYGQGFYCTEDKNAAALWAVRKNGRGFINTYLFEPRSLKRLDLTGSDEQTVLKWLTVLVSHRFSYEDKLRYQNTIALLKDTFPVSLSDYDYVVGYRADDNYFAYSRDFLANTLPLELLSEAMHLGKLGLQTVLLSPRSFASLSFSGSETVEDPFLYSRFRNETTAQYLLLKHRSDPSMHYLNEILKEYHR